MARVKIVALDQLIQSREYAFTDRMGREHVFHYDELAAMGVNHGTGSHALMCIVEDHINDELAGRERLERGVKLGEVIINAGRHDRGWPKIARVFNSGGAA